MQSKNGVCVEVFGKETEDLNRALKKLDKLLIRNGVRREIRRREHFVSKGERKRKSRFFRERNRRQFNDKDEILASEKDIRFRLLEERKRMMEDFLKEKTKFSDENIEDDLFLKDKTIFVNSVNKKKNTIIPVNGNETIQYKVDPDYEVKVVKVRIVSRMGEYFVLVQSKQIRDTEKIILSFPGGGVDEGEGITEAAVREYKEEVGVEINLSPFNYFSYAYIEKPFKIVTAYAIDLSEDIEFEKGYEIEEIYLMTKEEIDDLVRKRMLLLNNVLIWNDYKEVYGLIK